MNNVIEKKWINFVKIGDTGKTTIWHIRTKESVLLATIRWDSGFRKYSWFPEPDCKFEEQCTRDIADFLKELMEEHRQLKKQKKI
jgi:hypothetical protein